jgi:hypothetical protein
MQRLNFKPEPAPHPERMEVVGAPLWSFVAILFLMQTIAAQAGTVETAEGTAAGKIRFLPAAVQVDNKQVAWGEVLSLVAEPASTTLPQPNLLRLRSGESWAGLILNSSAKQLAFRGDWLGRRSVELDLVSVLEFAFPPPSLTGVKRQTLYRERGEPVPGSLLWMDNDSLGLDSPLGSTDIKRQGLVRYVFDNQPAPPPAQDTDEVGLLDGSILRGRAQPDRDGLRVEHPVLGRLDFPTAAVRFVLRHSAARIDLAALPPTSVETGEGTLAKGRYSSLSVSPLAFVSVADSDSTGQMPPSGCIKRMRVEPQLKVRYALPKRDGKKLFFRATVGPVPNAHGNTRIGMFVGSQPVWEKELSFAEGIGPLDLALPDGDELVIDVSFGTLLRFPCGVCLQDPHLVLVK